MTQTTQPETRVIFKLPSKLHRAAKIRAIMQGVTLEEALTKLVHDWVGENVLRMLDDPENGQTNMDQVSEDTEDPGDTEKPEPPHEGE